ncbi:MAG: hypothetical protein ACI90V_008828 [Bacillariaceae sp.]|jgi:hypothetical protein
MDGSLSKYNIIEEGREGGNCLWKKIVFKKRKIGIQFYTGCEYGHIHILKSAHMWN